MTLAIVFFYLIEILLEVLTFAVQFLKTTTTVFHVHTTAKN